MKPKVMTVVIFLAYLFAGCAPSVSVTRLGSYQYSPRYENAHVEVFFSKMPSCPYEELAHLKATTSQFDNFGNSNKLVAALESKARDLGGDGIILGPISKDYQEAVVIKFESEDCQE